jgi:hypothetical protein
MSACGMTVHCAPCVLHLRSSLGAHVRLVIQTDGSEKAGFLEGIGMRPRSLKELGCSACLACTRTWVQSPTPTHTHTHTQHLKQRVTFKSA